MSDHPLLVTQLFFTREKWLTAFEGITADEAQRRFEPINSMSWMMAHLANHEQALWVAGMMGHVPFPDLQACASGQPASVPEWPLVRDQWQQVTTMSAETLRGLGEADMRRAPDGWRETIGTSLQRLIFHYWYHLGESQAVRQLLGHQDLIGYVGRIPEAYQIRD